MRFSVCWWCWAKLIYIGVMLALISIKVDNIHTPPLLFPAGLYTISKQCEMISPSHNNLEKQHTHTYSHEIQCLISLLMSSM